MDIYKCKNTVHEWDSLKYAWEEVVAVVCFWKALNMLLIKNSMADDESNMEMPTYSAPKKGLWNENISSLSGQKFRALMGQLMIQMHIRI